MKSLPQLRRDVAVGIMEEYAEGDMERWRGTKKNYCTNVSVFIFPAVTPRVRAYLSAGVVYTYRRQDFAGTRHFSGERCEIMDRIVERFFSRPSPYVRSICDAWK